LKAFVKDLVGIDLQINSINECSRLSPDLKVFTIVVLTFGDRYKMDIATIDFAPKDCQGNLLNEIGHQIWYVCPK